MDSREAAPARGLDGRRVLVVGASSGLGAVIARELARRGAQVGAVARRAERLEALATERPERIRAIPGDVRDPDAPARWVASMVDALGGLDALVYAAGLARFSTLLEADFDDWRCSLETNLIGAAMTTRASIDALARSDGRAIYLSSISVLDHPPRFGLGLYMTSKIALDKMITVWDQEHPEIRFTRVSVGDTAGTEFGAGWEPADVKRALEEWTAQGYSFGRLQPPEVVARHVADLLCAEESVPFSCIQPLRRPVPGDSSSGSSSSGNPASGNPI